MRNIKTAGLLVIIISSIVAAQVPPHPRLLELLKNNSIRVEQCYALINSVDGKYLNESQLNKNLLKKLNKTNSGLTNTLIILVNFSDKMNTVLPSFFDNLVYSSNSGSLKSYFKEASYNQLIINTENTCAEIGWVTAPNSYNYYVNSKNGIGEYPNNSQKLVEDVIPLLDSRIDFSKYDNNKDGYVDALMFVHAGAAAEYTGSNNDFWSHAWEVSTDIVADGVHISRYSIQPEYLAQGVDVTIGVFAHELGHSLFGLPDLYDRDYSSWGLGDWSIMASGTWNGSPAGSSPALPDAWSRIKMGFNSSTDITTNQNQFQFTSVNSANSIYRIKNDSKSTKEYFLLENRLKVGFDSYLPGSGLLIYHIDENVSTQNDKEYYPGKDINSHYLVALEQADGLYNIEKKNNQGDQGDPFPGSSNNTVFNSTSVPNSCIYVETTTDFSIKNIKLAGSTIFADVILLNTKPVLVNMNKGWDLISFPSNPDASSLQKIVSNSSSPAYLFTHNYVIANDFYAGKGYWTRGINKIDFTLNAETSKDLVINLNPGWNLIGSSVNNTPVDKLIQSPLNNITTYFYGFESGYIASDTLKIGRGYWVKSITKGTLKVPANLKKTNSYADSKETLADFSSIEIMDAAGSRAKLYIGTSSDKNELPPLPPSNIFDVRWQSNNLIESLDNKQSKVLQISSAHFPIKIKSSNKSLKITDCLNGKYVNEILNEGKTVTIYNSSFDQLLVKELELPTSIELYQNYPNPFNPETTIAYVIPKINDSNRPVRISLKVYDLLGKEVAVLVNEMKLPGIYRSTLYAQQANLSSGVYFYKLTVDGTTITKKMILTK